MLIFDDSCEELSCFKQFVKIATARRHKGLNTKYIKHQSKLGRDVELQNTLIVLFKSSRDFLQINTLSQQLGLGSQLKEWSHDAPTTPYGHLLNDLTLKTVGSLQYCTKSGSVPTKKIYQQEQKQSYWTRSIEYVSILPAIQIFSQKLQKTVHPLMQKMSFNSSATV